MATSDPREPVTRTEYTVVEHRGNSGVWAFVIVLVLLAVAAGLYFAGVFNGRPLVSETTKTNVRVQAPSK